MIKKLILSYILIALLGCSANKSPVGDYKVKIKSYTAGGVRYNLNQLSLTNNGAYVYVFQTYSNGKRTRLLEKDTLRGTWELNDDIITMRDDDARIIYQWQVKGNKLILQDEWKVILRRSN